MDRSTGGPVCRRNYWLILILLALVYAGTYCWAGRPYLVRDINTATKDSDPDEMTLFNGHVYFAATEMSVGRELWRCSVSGGAPMLVKDINPGTTSSLPQYLTVSGKNLFFMAYDGVHGQELWKTDGTAAGTRMVKDIDSGPPAYNTYGPPNFYLTDVNGMLFFVNHDPANGWGLWKSDGSESGTVLLKGFSKESYSSTWPEQLPRNLTNVNGTLLFGAPDGDHGAELWRSDGTSSGTRIVKDIWNGSEGSVPECLFASKRDNCLYFFANRKSSSGSGLWKSDGTEAGTLFLKTLSPSNSTYERGGIIDLKGYVVFGARNAHYDDELWRTDGTPAGTQMVRDIMPGQYGSDVYYMTQIGDKAFFAARSNADKGYEIWKTDGTPSGTVLLYSLDYDDSPLEMASVGKFLVFSSWKSKGAYTALYDLNLYTLDINTGINNMLLRDILRIPAVFDSAYSAPWPGRMRSINGSLYLRAADDTHGMEMWKSNGAAQTTMMVGDINNGNADSFPKIFCASDGPLFFTATDSVHGRELWQTDRLLGSTKMVRDIYSGPCGGNIGWIRQYGNNVFFSAIDFEHGQELWKISGPGLGASMVKDIDSKIYGDGPIPVSDNKTDLFFFSQWRSDIHEKHIFRTDGTESGTVRIGNLEQASSVRYLDTNEGGKYFLIGYTDDYGNEIYQVDAMTTAANPLKDIGLGPKGSYPESLTSIGNVLYFTADTTSSAYSSLWNTDGTSSGTEIVVTMDGHFDSDLFPFNGEIYYSFNGQGNGSELWKSDETNTGTLMVKDIFPGISSSSPRNFTAAGSILYFTASDGKHGSELWRSDGTTTGTLMVKDINPGGTPSYPRQLTLIGDTLFFFAQDKEHGYELWKSDGTETGTVMVCDVNRSPRDSVAAGYYDFLGERNGVICFLASDSRGRGLWTTDGTEKGTVLLDILDPTPPIYTDYDGRLDVGSNIQIVYHKGMIYYPKFDGVHGYELWAMPLLNRASTSDELPAIIAK